MDWLVLVRVAPIHRNALERGCARANNATAAVCPARDAERRLRPSKGLRRSPMRGVHAAAPPSTRCSRPVLRCAHVGAHMHGMLTLEEVLVDLAAVLLGDQHFGSSFRVDSRSTRLPCMRMHTGSGQASAHCRKQMQPAGALHEPCRAASDACCCRTLVCREKEGRLWCRRTWRPASVGKGESGGAEPTATSDAPEVHARLPRHIDPLQEPIRRYPCSPPSSFQITRPCSSNTHRCAQLRAASAMGLDGGRGA